MSAPSDKARFYLEQSVPQLQEFKEKKIFSEEEIRNLVKRRSDFEHRVLTRASKPVDYARYAAWEIGLESLRQKRCKRLKIKSSSHPGQARIFKIFDRGIRKHPGDIALWMSYLEYTRKAKANKKFKSILTDVIRLHPTKPELWLYAAGWALEAEADINGARSYMQRGIRFCTTTRDLWIEYAKLEMIYLARIALRRKILGLDANAAEDIPDSKIQATYKPGFDPKDVISIPDFTTNIVQPSFIQRVEVDAEAAKDPMKTPALNGAIPLAIFDAARKQPFFCASAAAAFFDMFAAFPQVRCLPKILQHILECMMEVYATDPFTYNCYTRLPTIAIEPLSADFPAALGSSIERMRESLEKTKNRALYLQFSRSWIDQILGLKELDPAIRAVLQHALLQLK